MYRVKNEAVATYKKGGRERPDVKASPQDQPFINDSEGLGKSEPATKMLTQLRICVLAVGTLWVKGKKSPTARNKSSEAQPENPWDSIKRVIQDVRNYSYVVLRPYSFHR